MLILMETLFFEITINNNFSHENNFVVDFDLWSFQTKAVENDLTNFRVRFENLNC